MPAKRATAPSGVRAFFFGRWSLAVGTRWVLVFCAILFAARLASLPLYPLPDRTESRYGEISRAMTVSGDWLTPRIGGEPFWGKPPLSMWCGAASMSVFGTTEFAARLPAWIAGLLSLVLVWRTAAKLGGAAAGRWSALLFCSAPTALFMAGAVTTDPYLVLGITLSLYGIFRPLAAGQEHSDVPEGRWRTAFVVALGLAIASLSKGPIGLGFGAVPVVGLLMMRAGRGLLRGWPWARMIGIYALLVVPWYAAAEASTPGFLEYFLWGEHVQRFLDSDWSGDLYGAPTPTPPGTIWIWFGLALLPWIPAGIGLLRRARRRGIVRALRDNPLVTAAVWSMLVPLAFFTLASSVQPSYAFPAVPAACLLLGLGIVKHGEESAAVRFSTGRVPQVMALFALPALVALWLIPGSFWWRMSHRDFLADVRAPHVVYGRDIAFIGSARFYSDGRAVGAKGPEDPVWDVVRRKPQDSVVLTKRNDLSRIPDDIRSRLSLRRDFDGRYQVWTVGD